MRARARAALANQYSPYTHPTLTLRQLDARRCKGEVDYTETDEKEKVDLGELIDERQIAFRAAPPSLPSLRFSGSAHAHLVALRMPWSERFKRAQLVV